MNRYEQLVARMKEEFPRFRVVAKADSPFQKLIHYGLVGLTFGQMRAYLTDYQTTIGRTIYVTASWNDIDPDDRYITMCHERIHLLQFQRYTMPLMSLLYLLVPLPMGVSYFRAHFEQEAYAESMRAAAEVYGLDHVRSRTYRERILGQFTGASYGWMWPFRRNLEAWYDMVLASLSNCE